MNTVRFNKLKRDLQRLIERTVNNVVYYRKFDSVLTIKDDVYDESIAKKYFGDKFFRCISSPNVSPSSFLTNYRYGEILTEIGADKLNIDLVVSTTIQECIDKEILEDLTRENIEDDLLIFNGVEYKINKVAHDVFVNNQHLVLNIFGEKVLK